jgi:hypothetical protein
MTPDMRRNVAKAHTIDTLAAELAILRETEGGDTPIILGMEGSSQDYSPVPGDGVTVEMYWADATWGGECYLASEERARKKTPSAYDEAPDGAIRAVVIWPTS